MDALGSVNFCYVGLVQDEGHIELLKVPTETFEGYYEVERGRVISINEAKRCFDAQ